MTGPERLVFIGFHLTKKENQDRKSGPNWFGSVRFCGFNRSLGPDFQALEWSGVDWTGLDWSGLDWSGLDWSGLEWSGLEWTGLNWMNSVDWSGLDWTPIQWILPQIYVFWVESSGVHMDYGGDSKVLENWQVFFFV